MKRIPLSNGKYTLVDDADFQSVSAFKWSFDGNYASRNVSGKKVMLHRFLMGFPKGKDIDHINGNRIDNRRSNLRICTRSQNCSNNKRPVGSSGYRGIWKNGGKWAARIRHENGLMHLGTFPSIKEAVEVRNKKIQELRGEFAILTKI